MARVARGILALTGITLSLLFFLFLSSEGGGLRWKRKHLQEKLYMSVLNGVLPCLLATTSPGLSHTAGGDREGLGMSPEEEARAPKDI